MRCCFTRVSESRATQPTWLSSWLQFRRDEFGAISLDDVALFEICELGDLYAAFEVLGDFADIVFEAAERLEFAVPDDGRVADDTNLRIADELAGLHVTTGDRADFRDLEDLADFGAAEDDLALLPESPAREALRGSLSYVLERRR